jgi:Xaa-Pro aminopeptidase
MGASFQAISSTDANGAIVHYHPNNRNSLNLTSGGIYLLDTGG